MHGTPVFTPDGERLGDSKRAAAVGISLVCLSRVLMAVPGMSESVRYEGILCTNTAFSACLYGFLFLRLIVFFLILFIFLLFYWCFYGFACSGISCYCVYFIFVFVYAFYISRHADILKLFIIFNVIFDQFIYSLQGP